MNRTPNVRTLLAAGLLALSPALLAAQRPQLSENTRAYVAVDSAVVAITNVLLIDGTGGAARAGQTVIVQNGVITEVGPAKKVKVARRCRHGGRHGPHADPRASSACMTTCTTPPPAGARRR